MQYANSLLNIERNEKGQFLPGKSSYGKTHGMFGTKFYSKYYNAKQHCEYEKNNRYKEYGGRGIKLEWKSFDDFKVDMYESYLAHVAEFGERQTTLDRIDVNGNYCKANTRWATLKEQARNKRDSRKITFNGKTLSPIEWQEETGINSQTIIGRLNRGWPVEKLFIPPTK